MLIPRMISILKLLNILDDKNGIKESYVQRGDRHDQKKR
jgi:hypothetical protein